MTTSSFDSWVFYDSSDESVGSGCSNFLGHLYGQKRHVKNFWDVASHSPVPRIR